MMMTYSPLQHGCLENWSWNKNEQSLEVTFYDEDYSKIMFNCEQRACVAVIRGADALNSNSHYWEVKIDKPNEFCCSNTLLGVGTAKAALEFSRNRHVMDLLTHSGSWMLECNYGSLRLDDVRQQDLPLWCRICIFREFVKRKPKHPYSLVIGMLLDKQQGTLSYYIDGVSLGVAYTGLEHVQDELFPLMASSHSVEMTLGRRLRNYHSLQDRCRATIMKELLHKSDIDLLPLPSRMKQFLNDGWQG